MDVKTMGTKRMSKKHKRERIETYRERKERLLKRLKIRWVLCLVLVLSLCLICFAKYVPADQWHWLRDLSSKSPKVADVAQSNGFEGIATLLFALASVSGALAGAYRLRNLVANFVFERFLDRFNKDVFDGIPLPSAQVKGEQAMPWIEPSVEAGSEHRLEIWQAMHEWVSEGAEVQDDHGPEIPFSWALLVGRPGSGKSRTADELARSLARRDVLGSHARADAGWRARKARLQLNLSTLWRRALRKPRPSDPWDAGRTAHRRSVNGHEQNEAQSMESFKLVFETWQPRAPTLIVLEDPREGYAKLLIEWLSKGSTASTTPGDKGAPQRRPYRFAVRLLIVNQTLPSDLDLKPSQSQGSHRWGSRLKGLHAGSPWMVNERCYFSWGEWVAIKQHRFDADDKRPWAIQQRNYEQLTRKGHPLLVEALLSWLLAQAPGRTPEVAKLNAAQLLAERAERVRQALCAAGINEHPQWQTLAAASLVGGLPHAHRGMPPLIEPGLLQRVFPDEPEVQLEVPPIRPDLVGYAFADLVIQQPVSEGTLPPALDDVQHETAKAIALTAWRADPYKMLSTLMTLQGEATYQLGAAQGPNNQRMVAALEAATLQADGADAVAVARAFARMHLTYGRSLKALAVRIQAMAPEAAQQLATEELFQIMHVVPVAARDALALFSLACERALTGRERDPHVVASLMDAYLRLAKALEPRGPVLVPVACVPKGGFARLGAAYALCTHELSDAAANTLPTMDEIFAMLWKGRATMAGGLAEFAAACAVEPAAPERLQWLGKAHQFAFCTNQDELAAFKADLLALPEAIARSALGPALLCCAWARVAWAHGELKDAVNAKECAQEVARICEPFKAWPPAERRELAERLAQAWSYAAWAHGQLKDAVAAEACAQEIARICEPFNALPLAERRELAERLATAWTSSAYAHGQLKDAVAAKACAQEIAGICEPFNALPLAERYELAVRLAAAWRSSAYAHGELKDAVAAKACAQEATRICEPFKALPPAERRELAEMLAGPWNSTAYAHAQLKDAVNAKECAQEVARICEPFKALPLAERAHLAEWLAQAWSRTAWAHAQLKDAVNAKECAQEVASICEPFNALPLAERRHLGDIFEQAQASAK